MLITIIKYIPEDVQICSSCDTNETTKKRCVWCTHKGCECCGVLIKKTFRHGKENRFCNKECHIRKLRGKDHPSWKGGVMRHSQGYLLELKPEHRRANNQGYVPQHVLIVEKNIERPLKEKEEIHHINKIRDDNRVENLQLCKNRREHKRYDWGWTKKYDKWYKACRKCDRFLEVNSENFYRRKTGQWVSLCKKCCNP